MLPFFHVDGVSAIKQEEVDPGGPVILVQLEEIPIHGDIFSQHRAADREYFW